MAKSARSNNKKHLRQVRRDRVATTDWVTGAAAERAAKMQAIVAAPLASRLVHLTTFPHCHCSHLSLPMYMLIGRRLDIKLAVSPRALLCMAKLWPCDSQEAPASEQMDVDNGGAGLAAEAQPQQPRASRGRQRKALAASDASTAMDTEKSAR